MNDILESMKFIARKISDLTVDLINKGVTEADANRLVAMWLAETAEKIKQGVFVFGKIESEGVLDVDDIIKRATEKGRRGEYD